ncbi:MAG: hypothetical protein EOP07_15420 [Proteobacteria bacterium]|nr:MAG: hypothetical protein EOP07_15420 [Pseudomonadota bacterium]
MQPPPASKQIPIIPRGLRTRFAPSPTGFLHLGHVASAIYVWGIARRAGSEIILRMEDHDQGRVRKDYERAILSVPDLPLRLQSQRNPRPLAATCRRAML